MHVLNEHSAFNVTKELHLHKKSRGNTVYKAFLNYKKNQDLEVLSEDLGKINNASFWKSNNYDAKSFHVFLKKKEVTDFNYWQLIRFILEFDCSQNGKKEAGAKFPLHIAYFPFFKKRFSTDSYIFLARDPKNIAFSQFNKHKLKSRIRRLSMVFYTAIMFNLTIFYGKVVAPKKSILLSYENFKNNRNETTQKLCEFLEIPFNSEMTEIPVLGSRIEVDSTPYQLNVLESAILKFLTFPFSTIYKKSQ